MYLFLPNKIVYCSKSYLKFRVRSYGYVVEPLLRMFCFLIV